MIYMVMYLKKHINQKYLNRRQNVVDIYKKTGSIRNRLMFPYSSVVPRGGSVSSRSRSTAPARPSFL
jgi:hypothetical protein